MKSRMTLIVRTLAILLMWATHAHLALAQSSPDGWLGGKQSPNFPKTLSSPTTFLEQGQSPSTQALPGAQPATPQANAGAGQATTPAATSADSNWTLSAKEFQSGLASASGGKFGDTKYKWYGFVRLDGIFDFDPIKSTDMFVTSAIPVPQGRGQNAVLTPRYTRIGFDTSTPYKELDWNIDTKIEMDFFNGNTSGAFGSFPIRLRFAYIDFGPFRVGQAASLFMDYDVFPDVLDYEGPPGMVLMRQPIASVKWDVTDRFTVRLGVEQMYSDISWDDGTGYTVNPGTGIISTPGAPRNIQDVPDLTGNMEYKHGFGHVQVAGIARKLTYQPAVDPSDSRLGGGVNLTGTLHPWALMSGCLPENASERTPLQKSRFLGQFATGKGINRYIQDVNGLGLDAVFEPTTGFNALRSEGWFVCYEHFWTDKWISNICYSQTKTDLPDAVPDNVYKSASYVAANIIWLPIERMGVGLEYLIGDRENKDGEKGIAHRIQAGVQYKF